MAKKRQQKTKGRPRSLADATTRAKVLGRLRAGASRENAAMYAGISHDTISREAKSNTEFAYQLMLAESEREFQLQKKVGEAPDWRGPAFILERRYPGWSKRNPDQVTPEQVASTVFRVFAVVLSEVPPEFHSRLREKVDEMLAAPTEIPSGS